MFQHYLGNRTGISEALMAGYSSWQKNLVGVLDSSNIKNSHYDVSVNLGSKIEGN